jgi:hypothetical protein
MRCCHALVWEPWQQLKRSPRPVPSKPIGRLLRQIAGHEGLLVPLCVGEQFVLAVHEQLRRVQRCVRQYPCRNMCVCRASLWWHRERESEAGARRLLCIRRRNHLNSLRKYRPHH